MVSLAVLACGRRRWKAERVVATPTTSTTGRLSRYLDKDDRTLLTNGLYEGFA